ncbi:MAG: hypothetical protein ACTJIB_03930 [Pseudoalteromonas prydzensis]|uniref:hypothetical protein n=1 Tax=Pseudoalteromonas prydzensis TaxID=182141 RepID=UPI003F9D75BE
MNNRANDSTFTVDSSEFTHVPGAPFGYWVSEDIRKSFIELPSLASENVIIKQGIASADDFRFVRCWWEISKQAGWKYFAKGGDYSPFFSNVNLCLNWSTDGAEISANLNDKGGIRSNIWMLGETIDKYFFRPGITWPLRTTSGLNARVMPAGCVFGHKGPAIFIENDDKEHLLAIQSLLSSTAFKYLLSIQLAAADSAARSYEVGLMKSTPIPELHDKDKSKLAELASRSWILRRALSYHDETSSEFRLPKSLLDKAFPTIQNIENEYYRIQNEIDEFCFELYGFSELDIVNAKSEKEDTNNNYHKVDLNTKANLASLVSWAVGVIFNRFSHVIPKSLDSSADPFTSLTGNSPAMILSNVSDFQNNNGVLSGDKESSSNLSILINELLSSLGMSADLNLHNWIEREFFKHHLKQYSKSRRQAPIYWQIQTLSCSYSIWVYYCKLDTQTLLKVVNDHLDPKLKLLKSDIATQLNNSSRTNSEEKKLSTDTELKEELTILKDEILKVAKFWKPNLNDGVQITAAPLWRLFQHKAWQKKLKQTWEKLQGGEYDWAHLAFSTWPERVLKKCHEDRSLAIAHDVEDDLWHEVEVIKGRNKEPVWEWQPKPLSDAELHAYIREKIASDNRLKLYRSNQSANANGGAL